MPWSTEGVLGLQAVLQCGPSPSADLRMMAAGSRAAEHRPYKSRSRLGIAARPRATDLHGMLLVMGHHSGQPDQPPRPVEQPTGPHPAPADLDGRDAIRSDAGGDVHSAPTEATVTIQADASRYWKLHGRTHIGLLVLALVVVVACTRRRKTFPSIDATAPRTGSSVGHHGQGIPDRRARRDSCLRQAVVDGSFT